MFELSRPRRQVLQARTETVYGAPQAGLAVPAVAGQVDRGVSRHRGPRAT
jgi:hypothetical protein